MKLPAVLLLVPMTAMAAGGDEPDEWFNHKRHAALQLPCTDCHAGAEKTRRAGMPAAGRCLLCHKAMAQTSPVLQRLLKLSAAARPFRAQYDNLPEYVIFSHARHAQAKIACAACHGNVSEREQTEPANALNMKACVDCHQARGARIACRLCHHNLGQ